MGVTYDFSGWATKNDLKCSDGRTIRRDAFKDNDGQTVPLVWQHLHNDPANVLGHALLENRPEGVYAYCKFNGTDMGKNAKELVQHGDVNSLSIYANQLKQNGGDVYHGLIREVSLVLAGANPGALIDFPIIEHSGYEDEDPDEAVIYTGENLDLYHAEEVEEVKEEKVEEEEKPSEEPVEEEESVAHSDEKTVKDVFDELTEEQKNVVYYMIGQALEDAGVSPEEGEEEEMKHNVFDNETEKMDYLSHSDMEEIFREAKRCGSLKEAVESTLDGGTLMHAVTDRNGKTVTYGIADIDYLFPEARTLNDRPEFIQREMTWVDKVMSGVHKSPFSRVKSVFANITMDEARAKGYIKGKLKKDEVFSLLKRSTDPQTVYKKQKLDRDDIIDITDFDIVAWLKGEMRMMLNEELARAFLIGDGRLTSDDDHISEDHIRPIWKDAELYTIRKEVASGDTEEKTAKNFINAAIRARKDYKGSGNPTLFTTEDMLTSMLLIEDEIGHKLYKSESELATTLRVKEIVTVEVMENQSYNGKALYGIIVNLSDYNVGADRGGEVSMFDDFDIDYNQQKYLIETRCSGALTKPYSAIVLEGVGGGTSSESAS